MKRAIINFGFTALLSCAGTGGARADVIENFDFQGTLTVAVDAGKSVSGQFSFDFTTNTIAQYKFTAPGDNFDSSIYKFAGIHPFTSGDNNYLGLKFQTTDSSLELILNPALSAFFPQLFADSSLGSRYDCGTEACFNPPSDESTSSFASGSVSSDKSTSSFTGSTVSNSDVTPVPEPSSIALLGTVLAGLGIARRRRRTTAV